MWFKTSCGTVPFSQARRGRSRSSGAPPPAVSCGKKKYPHKLVRSAHISTAVRLRYKDPLYYCCQRVSNMMWQPAAGFAAPHQCERGNSRLPSGEEHPLPLASARTSVAATRLPRMEKSMSMCVCSAKRSSVTSASSGILSPPDLRVKTLLVNPGYRVHNVLHQVHVGRCFSGRGGDV